MFPYQATPPVARGGGWRRTAAMSTAVALLFMMAVVAPVAAAAPGNDNLANASVISTLPFDAYPDMSEATLESGEAIGCENGYGQDQSVWYAWTSSQAGRLNVQVDGSWGGQTAAVYGPFASLPTDVTTLGSPAGCVFYPGADNALHHSVGVGETYAIQLTTISYWGVSPHLGISETLPPANDSRSNAAVISGLPFAADADLTLATREAGEDKCGVGFDRTVWYRYTPSTDGTLEIALSRDQGSVIGALYAGTDLVITSAGAPACFSSFGQPTRFVVKGGTTYFLQLGDFSADNGSEPIHLAINPGPPPLIETVAIGPNPTLTRAGGIATVSFTVACNNSANFWIYASLRERLTRTVLASASSDNGGQCGPSPTVISLSFADPNHAFAPGSATVSAYIPAGDGWSNIQLNPSVTLKLKYR
jgi:hypothetical protein